VPSSSASGLCETIDLPIAAGSAEAPASQTIVLTALGGDGAEYQTTISSAISATTAIAQGRIDNGDPSRPPVPTVGYNLSTAGRGWQGGEADDGRWDTQYVDFAPGAGAGAIVLNQRAAVSPEPQGAVPLGADLQTLTFTFTRDGQIFNPTNLSMDVFDITSAFSEPRPNTNPGDGGPWHPNAGPEGWRWNYWDAVGFNVQPSSMAYIGDVAAYTQGAGAGTLSDPYRRVDGSQPTRAGGVVSDRFTFASFPSGSTMQYSNHDGRRGWHFISISGIRFDSGGCV